MLLLYSGLCLGRNYIALDVLSQMYPLDLCHKVVSTPEYPLTLRKNFVKLLQHLWIDRAPYSRLVLPDRIRIWNEIDKKDDTSIPCTEHNFSQLQPLKK
jgi:inositol 1,4,5-triphosphate receptor type 1